MVWGWGAGGGRGERGVLRLVLGKHVRPATLKQVRGPKGNYRSPESSVPRSNLISKNI